MLFGFLSLAMAILPTASMLALMWWLDRYEREPLGLLLRAFGWGAIGALLLALLVSVPATATLAALWGDGAANILGTIFLAPGVEEPAKALILLGLLKNRTFDNATDGFVYGCAAGLGFGASENFFYFLQNSESATGWLGVVFIRTLWTAPMHACATSVIGASLGWVRFVSSTGHRILAGICGLLAAIGIHFLWNGMALLAGATGSSVPLLLSMALFPVEFLLLFGLFQGSLWGESRIIARELGEEAKTGTLPPAWVPILSSWRNRNREGWLPRGVDPGRYVHAATTLAFRRHQERLCSPDDRGSYTDEVQRLRNDLMRMVES